MLHANGKSNLIDQHSYLANGFHNVVAAGGGANFEAYDSAFNNSYDDNVTIGTPNAKVLRNSIAGAGTGYANGASGTNLKFGGVDLVLEDNIIQQAAGWGVNLVGARSVRMGADFLDNNGRSIAGTSALNISGSAHITVCNNTFSESGAASVVAGMISSHVFFLGANDSLSFCGNVYLPIVTSANNQTTNSSYSSVLIHPDYSFDADPGATVTNGSIADNMAPQNRGFLSANAATALNASITNRPIPGYLTGLGLVVTGSTTVKIMSGTATDSSDGALLSLSIPCNIDLSQSNGLRAIDSTALAGSTTYDIFVVAPLSASNANCIASVAGQPSFINAGSSYQVTLFAMTNANSYLVYNVGQSVKQTAGPPIMYTYQGTNNLTGNPLAGLATQDAVTGTNIPANTSIADLKASNLIINNVPLTGYGISCFQLQSGTNARSFVGFNVAGPNIAPNTYISNSNYGACGAGTDPTTAKFNLVPPPSSAVSETVAFGGSFTITLSNPASAPSTIGPSNTPMTSPPATPTSITVYPGLYRCLGSVTTSSTSVLNGTPGACH